MFKYFLKVLYLCFVGAYALAVIGHSFRSPDSRFEEYYVNRYTIGSFEIESTRVHGSGSDLNGYFANVFDNKHRPLPIRFTDFDPMSQIEVLMFMCGMGILFSAIIPVVVWIYLKRPAASRLPHRAVVLISIGIVLAVLSFVPIISFGRPYVNQFVAG